VLSKRTNISCEVLIQMKIFWHAQKRNSIQVKLAHVDEEQIPPSFLDCIDKISLSIYVYDAF